MEIPKAIISILLLLAGTAPVRGEPVQCAEAAALFPKVTCEATQSQITTITSQIFDVVRDGLKLSLQVYQITPERGPEICQREAEILKTMNNIYVLQTLETLVTSTHFYKLTERIAMTLDDLILKKEMQSKEIAQLLEDLVGGIKYIHEHKFIHGGLTTQSIYIGGDEQPKISDFFSAMLLNDEGYPSGTTSYVEPKFLTELDQAKKYTEKTDTYALGVILFRLTQGGRLPFDRTHPVELHILHKIGNYEVNPGTDLWVMHVISACLRENEVDRPLLDEVREMAMAHASIDSGNKIKYPFTLSNKRAIPEWIRDTIRNDMAKFNEMFESFHTPKSHFSDSSPLVKDNKAKISYLNNMFTSFKDYLPNPFKYFKKTDQEEAKEEQWPLWVKILVMVLIGLVCLGIGFLMGRLIKARRKRKEEERRMTEQIEQNNI